MSFNPCSFSSIEFSVFSSSGIFFSFSLFAAVVAVAAGKGKGERGNKLKTSKLLCSQAPGSVSPQQYYYSLLCAVNHSGQTALPNVFKQSSPSKEEQAEFFCSGGRSSLSLSFSFSFSLSSSYSPFLRAAKKMLSSLGSCVFRMKRRRSA